MNKIIGFTELAYGADYLRYALLSAAPHVDKYVIVYARRPGRRNPYRCPDSPAVLREIAHETCRELGVPLLWDERERYATRYEQRNRIFELEPDADAILLTDADEVWSDGVAERVIKEALKHPVREIRVPIRFFWRSFDWGCYFNGDTRVAKHPIRVYRPKFKHGSRRIRTPHLNEFGFARRPIDFAYKIPSHGHLNSKAGQAWFENIWLKWTPKRGPFENVHYCIPYRKQPAGWKFPVVERFDKEELPDFMREHPYWNLDLIGGNKMPKLRRL